MTVLFGFEHCTVVTHESPALLQPNATWSTLLCVRQSESNFFVIFFLKKKSFVTCRYVDMKKLEKKRQVFFLSFDMHHFTSRDMIVQQMTNM